MFDLIIADGKIVTTGGIVKKNIAIKDGKVAKIFNDGEAVSAKETISASEKLIFPGIVDMHFHCRVPGNSEREDFDTATMAASHGGVTTLIEMPICRNSPCTVEALKTRVDYAAERAVIDFGFYGAGATKDEATAMALAEAGVVGFKFFLHSAPKGREDEFQGLCATNNAEVLKSLRANGKTGLITCVHPEDDGFIKGMVESLKEVEGNYHDQVNTRIPETEELALLSVGLIGKTVGARVHGCHLSSLNAVRALHYLKECGSEITAETCPPYMFMSEASMAKHGTYAKVNPPLKTEIHQKELIKAVKDGTICAVASDHAPFLPEEKQTEDFLNAPSGMPSVEFLGPQMLDKCIEGVFDYTVIPRTMSEAPAKLLGIYPKKGSLEVGSDADFFIFNPKDQWTVDITKLYTKSRMSNIPFQGKKFNGKIEATYVRGRKVYCNNEILGTSGYGEYVPGPRFIRI